ncbi:MAG TPA: YeeE/YedE thiosulfate transporter family protein [Cyclobacteriaceae bacterium]|nr:YeeE/YedE thiosulfate transporter family protein [Cyclobacteriaceae bacterium]
MEWIKEPWPWYVAGPLIGLMVPTLYFVANKPFGLSSSLKHICAACLPGNVPFFKYDWKKESWNILFVVGILLGGTITQIFLSDREPVQISLSTHDALVNLGISDFSSLFPSDLFNWKNLFTLQGLVFIILGGFMVGFGSRYAGGCTSGHAITGLSNFQLSSLVAVAGFFIGGLVITYFLLPLLLN